MDEHTPEPTRLPIEIQAEDPFIQLPMGVQLGIRQALTIAAGFFFWWLMMKVTTTILPLSGLFAGIIWSPLILGGLALALVKRDGVHLEEYLTRRIIFMISERHFILREKSKTLHDEEAEWSDLDDDDDWQIPRL